MVRLLIFKLRLWPLWFVLINLIAMPIHAQKEANYWYFGRYAGITFSTDPPTALIDGKMGTREGCSSISDFKGNLLFYTDGSFVWDRNHNLMPNGKGLLGHMSSSQSSVVIPKPGSTNVYYIFTVNGATCDSLGYYYSIVDITKNSGLGDVVTKNKSLITHKGSYPESITAVKHKNKRDVWVVLYNDKTSEFWTYLVTKNGVSTNPVKKKFLIKDGFTYIGKSSPDGSKMAFTTVYNGIILCDFNSSNGVLSNIITLDSGYTFYGVEFSPDSKLLYVSGNRSYNTWLGRPYILQYSLLNSKPTDIINSVTQVAFIPPPYGFNSLQLGPDGKLWAAVYNHDYLHCIEYPNKPGASCSFTKNKVYLKGRKAYLGLPSFIQSFFKPEISLSTKCFGDTSWFFTKDSLELDSVAWSFGDPNSGKNNSATGFKVDHLFSDTGQYIVRSISYRGIQTDTTFLQVEQRIYLGRISNFDSPQYKCIDDTLTLTLDSAVGVKHMLWKNDSTGIRTQVAKEGLIWVRQYYGAKCYKDDTIMVMNHLTPQLNLVHDTVICDSNKFRLGDGQVLFTSYLWNTSDTSSSIEVNHSDTFSLIAIDSNGCVFKDTSIILFNSSPKVNLGSDTTYCDSMPEILVSAKSSSDASYLWNTESLNSSLKIELPGQYWVKVQNYCGSAVDSITLNLLPTPRVELDTENIVCDRSSIILYPHNVSDSVHYHWSTGATGHLYTAKEEGEYSIIGTNICGIDTAKTLVRFLQSPSKLAYITDTVICDKKNLKFELPIAQSTGQYLWEKVDSGIIISDSNQCIITQNGVYSLTHSNQCGYTKDSFSVTFQTAPFAQLPNDTLFCNNDTLKIRPKGEPLKSANYIWEDFSEGFIRSISKPGLYWVKINNLCGQFSDSIKIDRLVSPEASLPRDTIYCDSFPEILLHADSKQLEVNYLWSTGSNENKISLSAPGNYWVQLSNECGLSIDSVNFDLGHSPKIDLGPDTGFCGPFLLELHARKSNGTIQWSHYGESDSSILITEFGHYSARVISPKGCSSLDSILVFDNCHEWIYFPNAFSPNNDGLNDQFSPSYNHFVFIEFGIYNRWGERIFYTQERNPKWNGQYKNMTCPIGIYMYQVRYQSLKDGTFRHKQGTFMLNK